MSSLFVVDPKWIQFSSEFLWQIAPLGILLIGVCVLLGVTLVPLPYRKWLGALVSFSTLITALGFACTALKDPHLGKALFQGMLMWDGFSLGMSVLAIFAAMGSIGMSYAYLERESLYYSEFDILILLSTLGAALLAWAQDFIVMFLALELMSLSVYLLVAFRRTDRLSLEASLKYFILGSVASTVLLFGVALFYGASSSTLYLAVGKWVGISHLLSVKILSLVAFLFILIGFLFKVGAVPFHFWVPDVYEGAPLPVTAWMSTGVKVGGFAALGRFVLAVRYGDGVSSAFEHLLFHFLWWASVATMVLGSVVALWQTNLKRLFAYSSIVHSGYLLLGVCVALRTEMKLEPVMFYLLVYVLMNLGAFSVLVLLSKEKDAHLMCTDLVGMSQKRPFFAFAFAVFLFSLAGIPPTAGFVGKYWLFYSAVESGEVLLVVIAVLTSAVSAYYYLNLVVQSFLKHQTTQMVFPSWAGPRMIAFLMAVFVLVIGVLPLWFLNWIAQMHPWAGLF